MELGSGGSFLNEMQRGIVTSDIVPGVGDYVIRAENIPFANDSVRAIFMGHSLHHVPNVEAFCREAFRVLVPEGIISMVEVAHTPLARFVFSKCCKEEKYDDQAESWDFQQSDAMADANQALSWIMFSRDYKKFRWKFPGLQLERTEFLPWLGYLLSGGVTRKNVIPNCLVPLVGVIEVLLKPIAPLTSLHWFLTVRKVS